MATNTEVHNFRIKLLLIHIIFCEWTAYMNKFAHALATTAQMYFYTDRCICISLSLSVSLSCSLALSPFLSHYVCSSLSANCHQTQMLNAIDQESFMAKLCCATHTKLWVTSHTVVTERWSSISFCSTNKILIIKIWPTKWLRYNQCLQYNNNSSGTRIVSKKQW